MDAPLMWYSSRVALQSGMDVLGLQYGFQVQGSSGHFPGIGAIVGEVLEGVKGILEKHHYSRYAIIAKSIGTEIASRFVEEMPLDIRAVIFLTPLPSTIGFMNGRTDLMAIIGDRDPLFPISRISEIRPEGKAKVVGGADHLLEIDGDPLASIDVLKRVASESLEFIRARTQ